MQSAALSTTATKTAQRQLPHLVKFSRSPSIHTAQRTLLNSIATAPNLNLHPQYDHNQPRAHLNTTPGHSSLNIYLYDSGIAGPDSTKRLAPHGARGLNFLIANDDRLRPRFSGGVQFHQMVGLPGESSTSPTEHNIAHFQEILNLQKDLRSWLFSAQPNTTNKTLMIGGDHGGSLAHIHLFIAKQIIKHALEANQTDFKNHPLYFTCDSNAQRYQWCQNLDYADTIGEQVMQLTHIIAEGGLSISNLEAFKQACPLVFIDAHADLHTPERSPTKNFHVMLLATALGHGHAELIDPILSPNNVALIAQRDVEPEEVENAFNWGLHYFPAVADEADFKDAYRLAQLKQTSDAAMVSMPVVGRHLEFDTDALDARFVPNTGTPVGTGSARNTQRGPSLNTVAITLHNVIDDVDSISLMEVGHDVKQQDVSTIMNMKRLSDAILGLDKVTGD